MNVRELIRELLKYEMYTEVVDQDYFRIIRVEELRNDDCEHIIGLIRSN